MANPFLRPFVRLYRRFFDPRFAHIETAISEHTGRLHALVDESSARTAGRTDQIAAVIEEHAARVEQLLAEYIHVMVSARDVMTIASDRIAAHDKNMDGRLSALEVLVATVHDLRDRTEAFLDQPDDDTTTLPMLTPGRARLLNFAESHLGFRARAGLWFNPPDVVRYRDQGVTLDHMSERIVELPFVLQQVALHVAAGERVLDVGCAESLLAVQLASLGYQVTALDPRGYSLTHPNLDVQPMPLENWHPEWRPTAIICLSTLEHLGLGAYHEAPSERLDARAMRLFRGWLDPKGILILTTPIGAPAVDGLQRTYSEEQLLSLFEGWSFDHISYAEPVADGWSIVSEFPKVPSGVALVVAHPGDHTA